MFVTTFGSGGGMLGAVNPGACAVGVIRSGGSYRQTGPDTLALTPDQAPGVTYTLTDAPERPGTIQDILDARGPEGRIAFSGTLLDDDTIIMAGGWGTMGPNEVWNEPFLGIFQERWRGGNVNWETVFSDQLLGPVTICLGQHPLRDAAEPEPVAAWEGSQVATVTVQGAGIPANVRLAGEDGFFYTLAPSSNPTAATELATTAPQGTRLVVTGRWDSEAGEAAVFDWYIEELGEGVKKYGIGQEGEETGDIVHQRPDVPSTDWPGGPDPETGVPRFGPPEENGAAEAGDGGAGLLALAAMGAMFFLVRREREE